MTIEDILSNVNYNIEKIFEELRKRIMDIPEIDEIVDKHQIIYRYLEEDFCAIKIKKENIEIDFKTNKMLEDPMDFSWKIKRDKKNMFDRRMHIKNIFDIDVTFDLIFQSYKYINSSKSSKSSNKNYNKF